MTIGFLKLDNGLRIFFNYFCGMEFHSDISIWSISIFLVQEIFSNNCIVTTVS